MATPSHLTAAATIAELVVSDLEPLGDVTFERQLDGCALLEDGVAFGHVDRNGALYLRAEGPSVASLVTLGSRRHPRLACWSVPESVAADTAELRCLAEAAIELAHFAFSFGVDNGDCAVVRPQPRARRQRWSRLSRVLLAA